MWACWSRGLGTQHTPLFIQLYEGAVTGEVTVETIFSGKLPLALLNKDRER